VPRDSTVLCAPRSASVAVERRHFFPKAATRLGDVIQQSAFTCGKGLCFGEWLTKRRTAEKRVGHRQCGKTRKNVFRDHVQTLAIPSTSLPCEFEIKRPRLF